MDIKLLEEQMNLAKLRGDMASFVSLKSRYEQMRKKESFRPLESLEEAYIIAQRNNNPDTSKLYAALVQAKRIQNDQYKYRADPGMYDSPGIQVFWDDLDMTIAKQRTGGKAAAALKEARDKIAELSGILERVQKEPLILQSVEKLSKDKKYAFVKKGEFELRIEATPGLKVGDEILLHPKTMQIVEALGVPPLEVSRFAPDTVPNVLWDDIGGLEEAKADLREAVELPHKHAELYALYRKNSIKGVLLSGPPGCGKTMLGKACATALSSLHGKEKSRTGFLYVKGPEILNCYVGESEKAIRDIFFDAKRHKQEHGYPAVVFIDEADAILAARGSHGFGMASTVVPMFLTEMDGLEESSAIVILATNRPDILDPAIGRDGRIDRKITVTRPTEESAREILLKNLEKTLIHADHLEELAKDAISIIYSADCKISKELRLRDVVNGAMLANCVNIASSYALHRDIKNGSQGGVIKDDILLAIHRIQQQCAGIKHESI